MCLFYHRRKYKYISINATKRLRNPTIERIDLPPTESPSISSVHGSSIRSDTSAKVCIRSLAVVKRKKKTKKRSVDGMCLPGLVRVKSGQIRLLDEEVGVLDPVAFRVAVIKCTLNPTSTIQICFKKKRVQQLQKLENAKRSHTKYSSGYVSLSVDSLRHHVEMT